MRVLEALAEITVYSAVLYLAILLFRTLFRNKMSAAMQYGVWFLLLLRLLMPVTIEGGFHLITLPQQTQQVTQLLQAGSEHTNHNNALPVANSQETATNTMKNVTKDESMPVNAPAIPQVNRNTDPGWWSRDLEHVLPAIWFVGIISVCAWFAFVHLRLSASILRNKQPLPSAERRLFERLKLELGIRHGPRPVILNGISTPALSISVAPILLLPSESHRNPETLEHIFRHELSHYKRGDHIISLLLMVLRCVYWFNPVVWLAAHQMQQDMEVSCDSTVVKKMGNDEKRQYASTLLMLFSQPGSVKPVMGMGMEHNRTSAEKRIRGVFMSEKSSTSTRLAAVITAILLLVACFTTACQPTTAQPASADLELVASAKPTPTASPAQTAAPTPTSEPTPTPAPTVNPDISQLQANCRLIAGNIAAGICTFAVTKDGKVHQAGNIKEYQIDTSKWSKMVAISTGFVHVAGLRSDGTVVVTGGHGRPDFERNTKEWKNIVEIAAGGNDVIMGLKADGTVVSTGIFYDSADPNKVKNWKDIVAIAAGEGFGIGLKADGTVVATGNNEYGQCNVGEWKDIVAIAASSRTVLGLKADGTVVATGYNIDGECSVEAWRDIVAVAVGDFSSYGLKADGTVISAGDGHLGQRNTDKWTDIIAISAGSGHVVGLRHDGAAVAVGSNEEGACEVDGWNKLATTRLK